MGDKIVTLIPKDKKSREKINKILIAQIENLLEAAKEGDIKDIAIIHSRWSNEFADIILVPPQDYAHLNLMLDVTKQTFLDMMVINAEGLIDE